MLAWITSPSLFPALVPIACLLFCRLRCSIIKFNFGRKSRGRALNNGRGSKDTTILEAWFRELEAQFIALVITMDAM